MLEWSVQCPKCGAWFGGVALPPFVWWTRTVGATCPKCKTHWRPDQLRKLEEAERGE